MFWSYREPTKLWLRDRDGSVSGIFLPSTRGVRQGDPLGGLAFAVALHPLLLSTLATHRAVRAVAIQDDVTFVGKPEDVMQAAASFARGIQQVGLKLSPSKSCFMWFCNRPIETRWFERFPGITTHRDNCTVLGIPIGIFGKESVATHVRNKVEKLRPIFDVLEKDKHQR